MSHKRKSVKKRFGEVRERPFEILREYQRYGKLEVVEPDAPKVKVGDIVERVPQTFYAFDEKGRPNYRPLTGTVIFVHPEGRYHVVEWTFKKAWHTERIRESFMGVAA